MKRVGQFALMLAVVLPLLTPGMACTLPHAHLSARGHACCTSMQRKCGMAKPSAQGCCQKEAPSAANWNAAVQTGPTHVQADVTAPAVLLRAVVLPVPLALPGAVQPSVSAPPHSPPSAVSVLRI